MGEIDINDLLALMRKRFGHDGWQKWWDTPQKRLGNRSPAEIYWSREGQDEIVWMLTEGEP